jgi:hypothetical protein
MLQLLITTAFDPAFWQNTVLTVLLPNDSCALNSKELFVACVFHSFVNCMP